MLKRFTGLFYSDYSEFYRQYSPKDARAKHLLEISPYKKRVIQEIETNPEAIWEIIECNRISSDSDSFFCYECEHNEILWIDLLIKCNTVSSDDLSNIPDLNWKKLSGKMVLCDKVLRQYRDEIDWDKISKSVIHRKDVEFIKNYGNSLQWSTIRGLEIDLDRKWSDLLYRDSILSVLGYALEKRFLKRIDLENHLEYIVKNYLDRLISNYNPRDYYDLSTDNFSNNEFFEELKGKSPLLIRNCKKYANWPKELLPILLDCPDFFAADSIPHLTQPESVSSSYWNNFDGVEWDLEYYKSHLLPIAPEEFWSWISGNQKHILPDDFIMEYSDKLDWNLLIKKQQLSENLLELALKKIPLKDLCSFQKLSENFVNYHLNDLNKRDLNRISIMSELSEEFMHDNRDKIDWFLLCEYQKLSPEFIEKHVNYVNWGQISQYQDLTQEFIERYGKRLNEIKLDLNSHLKKQKKTFNQF